MESHHHLLKNDKDPKTLFLHGEEINCNAWAIAMMNILLHDMEADLHLGNSLIDPKFIAGSSLKKFDIVMANPPWNQGGYDNAFYDNDAWGRFRYGTPPKSSADWAWTQHILASLRDGGRAAVVLDKGSIFRGSNKEKNIRKRFVENDVIEAVFLLPDNLAHNTPLNGLTIPPLRRRRSRCRRRSRRWSRRRSRRRSRRQRSSYYRMSCPLPCS